MEQKRILVVDDDENICRLLKMYLANEGFLIYVANDGSKALEYIEKSLSLDPDFVDSQKLRGLIEVIQMSE